MLILFLGKEFYIIVDVLMSFQKLKNLYYIYYFVGVNKNKMINYFFLGKTNKNKMIL